MFLKPLSALILVLSSQVIAQQDLVAGTELTDSQLSLSLAKTMIITPRQGQEQSIVLSQYGVYNKATINQQANSANNIQVSQDGINNSVTLSQHGADNAISVNQYGDDNLAEVVQVGDTNIANVIQAGEQRFRVHQIGNDMVVNVTQY